MKAPPNSLSVHENLNLEQVTQTKLLAVLFKSSPSLSKENGMWNIKEQLLHIAFCNNTYNRGIQFRIQLGQILKQINLAGPGIFSGQ